MSADPKQIALFDFDGTLTRKDSLLHFLKFSIPAGKLLAGTLRFFPTYLKYLMKVTGNAEAKEKLFQIFFSDLPLSQFDEWCRKFSENEIPRLIRPEAINKLNWHLAQGHDVAIVSASIRNYLEPYFQQNEVVVIATELEVEQDRLTGKFSSPNCYGSEKCKRITERFNIDDYSEVYVYGDSAGDKDMLAMGTRQFFRKFS